MNKVFTIAKREFKAAVMTKAFLVSIIVMPLMMGGSLLIQYVFRDSKSLEKKTFVVIDRTPGSVIFPKLKKAVEERNKKDITNSKTGKQIDPEFELKNLVPSENTPEAILKQRYELAEQVRERKIYGYIDIGSKILEVSASELQKSAPKDIMSIGSPTQEKHKAEAAKAPDELLIRYYSNSPTYQDFFVWVWQAATKAVQQYRAGKVQLTETSLEHLLLPTFVANKNLPKINKLTGEIEDGKDVNFLISFIVPFGIVIIMFMVIMVGATPLMQGVVEEKMQRISEVLLASAQPFQLMLGKLLGGVAVSLLLGSVYVIGALYAAWQYGFSEYFTPMVVFWFLLYLALAVLMFGSLFIAVGAACTDIKETQSLLMPVMLLATFPMFFLTKVIQEPDGAIARGLSFFPFATPSIMVARLAIPPGASVWDPIIGVIIVLVTTLFCVWVASRIFRVGLLMQGKGASFAEIVKWVWKG
ncbi:MAG TPA: ABC transporter permease [Gemmatales bacterium]|nr:ABC transporter permease [Gemmatales bacterium]